MRKQETAREGEEMKLPSVTTVLSPFADFSRVPPDVLEAACERGTAVHTFCAAYAAAHAIGIWAMAMPVPEELRGYFDSFRLWFDVIVSEVISVEEELIDDSFGFCGHPDLVVKSQQGETLLVDLKSTLMHPRTFQLQCAAYTHLIEKKHGIKIDRAGTLHLSKEGKAPQMRWTENNREAITIFLQLLSVHNFLTGGRIKWEN
ncbi:MAG: Dna2/Cas4 domain-containing protein [Acidobacteriota bacterium]